MNKQTIKRELCSILIATILLGAGAEAYAAYGKRFCNDPRFECIRIKAGESWASLWSDEEERIIVKKLNRMNIPLYPGLVIAVPKDLGYLSVMDVSPFRPMIPPPGKKTIFIDQKRLAWGAYNANGELLNWGPTSSGRNYCADIGSRCNTKAGIFYVYDRRGAGCKSSKFPIGKGGAPMPYCMFFHGGQALHGSATVPGYNDSHGCVRLFPEDAKWLDLNFVGGPGGPTRVVVESL